MDVLTELDAASTEQMNAPENEEQLNVPENEDPESEFIIDEEFDDGQGQWVYYSDLQDHLTTGVGEATGLNVALEQNENRENIKLWLDAAVGAVANGRPPSPWAIFARAAAGLRSRGIHPSPGSSRSGGS